MVSLSNFKKKKGKYFLNESYFIEAFLIKIIFRERRDNYVPEISALENDDLLAVDPNVQAMIKAMDFDNKEGLLETLKVEGGQ